MRVSYGLTGTGNMGLLQEKQDLKNLEPKARRCKMLQIW